MVPFEAMDRNSASAIGKLSMQQDPYQQTSQIAVADLFPRSSEKVRVLSGLYYALWAETTDLAPNLRS